MGLDIHSIHRLDLGTPGKNPLNPPQHVCPQGFPRMILFQKHFDPFHIIILQGVPHVKLQPQVFSTPPPLQRNVSNMF